MKIQSMYKVYWYMLYNQYRVYQKLNIHMKNISGSQELNEDKVIYIISEGDKICHYDKSQAFLLKLTAIKMY